MFDTETYDFTWVAGSSPRLSGEGVVDHQDGKQAKLELWSFAVHVGGFIYWMEKAAINTWQSSLYVMRRMSTVPPYGIETLPGLSANPAGFTGSTSSELSAWSEEVNPATGLRNYYNSDVAIPFEGYPWKLIHYDGYIYFGHVCEVRRVPVTGGSAETLLWGYTTPYDRNAAPTGTLYRDHESDYAETPEGAPNPNNPTSFPNDPHHLGTKVPELEGLNFSHYGWVVLDDDLLFVNASGASMEQFAAGNRWARLHLPTLIDSFDSDGPQRVNRESPQWVTISGGTAMWEQRSSWTAKVNALDLRWRDGGRPLMNAPMKAACVPTAGPLAGKLVFGFQVWSGDLTPIDFVYELASEWPVAVVSVLEPGFDLFEIDVTLLFEGRALKGYANTHTLNPADAPEEVQLS